MALTQLVAEGVGPFDRLELDLSDGAGKPHLGPHIIAGVNGSGKTTVLRAIAWALDEGKRGFPYTEWRSIVHGDGAYALARMNDGAVAAIWGTGLSDDATRFEDLVGRPSPSGGGSISIANGGVSRHQGNRECVEKLGTVASYGAMRTMAYLDRIQAEGRYEVRRNALAFNATIENNATQKWWVDAFTKEAIAHRKGEANGIHTETLKRFQNCVQQLIDRRVSVDVDIESPEPLPRFWLGKKALSLGQLPDGVRSTLGWIADYLRRQEIFAWEAGQPGLRKGILLIDEVDAHLHPKWQRHILPAMRAAFPEVQIIVTTHSPFVIASCREARVHVLELDEKGRATARPPIPAPVGQRIGATIKDIFGVSSDYDVETEAELNEWNDLERRRLRDGLSEVEAMRFEQLSTELAERSESLRVMIAKAPELTPGLTVAIASAIESYQK